MYLGGQFFYKEYGEAQGVWLELGAWVGGINFAHIKTKIRGKGLAKKALKELTDVADRFQVPITAIVKPTDKKGLKKSELYEWYKRHGFVKMRGDEIVRKPRNIQGNPRDYCYRKIKKKFKVFPSRYAGFALARCRRKLKRNPVPPKAVARVACRGLAKRRIYKRGGTAVGVARGRDLCNRRKVTMATVKRMSSYFARHRASRAENRRRIADPVSPARIADELWGGTPGWRWAKKVLG